MRRITHLVPIVLGTILAILLTRESSSGSSANRSGDKPSTDPELLRHGAPAGPLKREGNFEFQALMAEYTRLNQMWNQFLHSQHIILNILIVGTVSILAAVTKDLDTHPGLLSDLRLPLAILITIAYPLVGAFWFSHGRMMKFIRKRKYEIEATVRELVKSEKVFRWDDGDGDVIGVLAFDFAVLLVLVGPPCLALFFVRDHLFETSTNLMFWLAVVGLVLSTVLVTTCTGLYLGRYGSVINSKIGARKRNVRAVEKAVEDARPGPIDDSRPTVGPYF